MKGSKNYLNIAAVVLAVVSVCVTGISYGFFRSGRETFLGKATDFLFRPVQTLFLSAFSKAGDYYEVITDAKGVLLERETLLEENASLKQENRALISFREENNRLRALLELKENSTHQNTVACEILARGSDVHENFVIDKGTKSGISVNDAVVFRRALVGKVAAVSQERAIVAPITQTGVSVSARSLREQKLFIAEGTNEANKLSLSFFEEGTKLKEGDTVETSGMGGVFPEGLLLGVVGETQKDEKGNLKEAEIETAVEVSQLHEVFVYRMGSDAP